VERLANPDAKNKKRYRSILPSTSEIVKAAQALEHTAKDVLATEKFATESGERVKFKKWLKLFNYCSNRTDLMK
jgi:hypothetical protein